MAAVEAINKLNPSNYTHILGTAKTIQIVRLSPPTLPKQEALLIAMQ